MSELETAVEGLEEAFSEYQEAYYDVIFPIRFICFIFIDLPISLIIKLVRLYINRKKA